MSVRGESRSKGKAVLLELLNSGDENAVPVTAPILRVDLALGLLDLIAADLDEEGRRSEAGAIRLSTRAVRAALAGEEVEL